MKLLYATGNNSKIYNMKRRLEGLPIEIVTPKELNIKVDVVEDGKTAVENALKKAQAYYEKTKIPTIAGDSGLYIENIPPEKQPGLFVRRVNGTELSDDEMIEYYAHLINTIGGKSISYYITGLALVGENGIVTTEIKEDEFILSSTISKNRNHRGNPLDVMTIDPTVNKYYTEMSDEEFKHLGQIFDIKCIEFIVTNLLENKKTLKKKLNLYDVRWKIMNKQFVDDWLNKLRVYWLNKDIEKAISLFANTTFYQETPFMTPYTTIEEIREEWQHVKNENTQHIEFKILAIDKYVAIVEWLLIQNDEEYDGIYEIKFNDKLECIYFKSWEMTK